MSTTIAILDESIPEQIRTNPSEMRDIQLVWSGTSPDELEAKAPTLRPGVLVLDLDLVGPEPLERTRRIQTAAGSDLVVILYKFAKRDLVGKLAEQGSRLIKAPISLRALRTQMMSVIIRDIFRKDEGRTNESAEVVPNLMPGPPPPARLFTSAQLGRLQEIATAVDCECPNHMSDILQRLQAFEDYSAVCESKDDKDAQIHHMLYVHTGQARHLMEEALQVLVKYENIQI